MKYAILFLLLLSACCQKPEATTQTNNPNFPVDKLFSTDGCTVYRFQDEGSSHYFTNCPGQVMSRIHSGKTTRPENISGSAQ